MNKRKNDLTLKIFSVAIAIVLWSYVMGLKNPEWPREYKVDVEFTNIESLDRRSLIIMEPSEVRVSVGVIGRRSNMEGFNPDNNIVAQLDLRGYGEGESRVPVTVTLKDSPPGVSITKVEPSHVLVTIEKVVTEEKIVNIRTSGSVSAGYSLGELEASPRTILIKGPRSWVNKVSDVFVVVPLSNESTNSRSYPVQITDHNGDEVLGLEVFPSVVEVTVPVYRKATLPIEVVFENELPENYVMTNMEVSPSSVTIRGGNQITDYTSIKTKPVDLNLLLDNPSLEVELDLPDGVELVDPGQRIVVNATIEEMTLKEFEFNSTEISTINKNEDLALEGNEGNVLIQVKGTAGILETLTKERLKPYIDLENLQEGVHEVGIQVNTIEGVTIESIRPETWTVTLRREVIE